MAETSNGKLEGTMEVEGHDEEKEVVLKEDLEDLKPGLESVKDITVNEDNSEPVNDADADVDAEDKSPQAVAEHVVSLSQDWTEEKKTSPSLNGSDGVSHVVTDVAENGFEEKPGSSSVDSVAVSAVVADEEIKEQPSNETVAVDLVPMGVEETTSDETVAVNNKAPPAPADISKGIEETEIPFLNDSIGESSVPRDLESKEIGDNSLPTSADAFVVENRDTAQVGNKNEIPESTGNPPAISLARHPLQPTSWSSCCGLFEVLRRRSEQ
ncbi:hypothetical protein SLE2022_117930 [Rubroshorea leprosula]